MSTDADEAVQAAIEAGFSVVPADMDKRPKVRWKQWQTEEQTEEDIEGLGHGSIWGVVTGALYGITVLDFDFDAGGEETLHALGLEEHVTVQTPGGAHVYVEHPGHPVKNAARKWDEYPGLDVRGDGGLAWFAGRGKKGVYTPLAWPPEPITIDPDLMAVFFPHPQETQRAERGEWTGQGHGTPEAARYLTRVCEDIRNAGQGSSNAVLNKSAYAVGGLVASGQLDSEVAYGRLLDAAIDRGAGDAGVVIDAAMSTGAEAPWAFDPDADEWIPAIAYKAFRSGGVPEPEPFPIDALPSPLAEFVRQGARAVSCPPDFFGAGVLPVLGAGIGGYVDLEVTETWRESALLYTALVGVPSVRKSPAMSVLLAPVYDATTQLREAARREAEENEENWAEVTPAKLVVDDATIEALFGVLERNPRGVIMTADELDGWVKGMGAYKGGLGRDRQHWLSIWSRKPLDVERKTTKSIWIPKPFVAVIGGIQPDPLADLMHGSNDGLLPRILMAQGEPIVPRLNRDVLDPAVAAKYAALWHRLRDEGMNERTVQFTPAGWESFQGWANEHYKSLARIPGALAGAWGKMDGQAARISLILAMVLESEVTPEIVERAVSIVRYFQSQAAGIYLNADSESRWEKQFHARTQALGRYILDNPGTARAELMQRFKWAGEARTLDKHLESLVDYGIRLA